MDFFQKFSILSWNIKGASSKVARRHVRELIMLHHPSLFCVYETRVQFTKVEKFWSSMGYKPIFIQEANGNCGGIWILSCSTDIDISLLDSMH